MLTVTYPQALAFSVTICTHIVITIRLFSLIGWEVTKMKKTAIVALLLIIILALSSCSGAIKKIFKVVSSDGEFVMGANGVVVYKDAIYSNRDGWDNYYNYYDSAYNHHQGEVIGTIADMYGAFGDISKACEEDFGDSVVKVSAGYTTDLWFKEGFALPDFETVKIDSIYIDTTGNDFYIQSKTDIDNRCVKSIAGSDTKNLYITDVVDFEVSITDENLYIFSDVYDFKGYMLCTLSEYKTIYLGFYEIYDYQGELYLQIDKPDTMYKIKAEYQKLLKDSISELQ